MAVTIALIAVGVVVSYAALRPAAAPVAGQPAQAELATTR
jgi:hypothetical protein